MGKKKKGLSMLSKVLIIGAFALVGVGVSVVYDKLHHHEQIKLIDAIGDMVDAGVDHATNVDILGDWAEAHFEEMLSEALLEDMLDEDLDLDDLEDLEDLEDLDEEVTQTK